MRLQTTYAGRSNVLQHICTNHNPVYCKENFKFFVSSVIYFEETLLMDNKIVSHYS